MIEQAKAVLLNSGLFFSINSISANPLSSAILLGKVDYKRVDDDFLLEKKTLLSHYSQSTQLRPEAISFIENESAADIYVGNVNEKYVKSIRTNVGEANLSSSKLKKMFLQIEGWDENMNKAYPINRLRKRYRLIDYYDSNERDILDFARTFRPFQFYLVQNGFNGRIFSKQDPPNVHRIAKLPEMVA